MHMAGFPWGIGRGPESSQTRAHTGAMEYAKRAGVQNDGTHFIETPASLAESIWAVRRQEIGPVRR